MGKKLPYNSVCLYADGEKISCTPNDLLDAPMAINFNDYNIGVTEVYAKEFRLNWENDKCAQIDELYIYITQMVCVDY